MKKLKATVVSAYREAFPTDLMISNRCEARERIHTFLNNIPIMKEINGKDREVVVEKGVYAALVIFLVLLSFNHSDDIKCYCCFSEMIKSSRTATANETGLLV